MNISWFIAKAYLANLYYTTQCDASLTIKTCDDILHVFKHSRVNQNFAETTFAVAVSTQWTGVYDKEIQELLGFYSLCTYVLDKFSSRSVYLGVCPVQFAVYLKLRAVRDIGCCSQIIFTKLFEEFLDHRNTCRSNHMKSGGGTAVHAALHNYSIADNKQ